MENLNNYCFKSYLLRFTSAYVVVAFTVQRLLTIYVSPKNKFKSKKYAWITVLSILIIGLVINIWVPFLFVIQTNEAGQQYCDIRKEYKIEYFNITFAYICLIMFIPIVTVFVCNCMIIFKTFKVIESSKNSKFNTSITLQPIKSRAVKDEKFLLNETAVDGGLEETLPLEDKQKSVNKVAKILLWISFSFAILNLP